MATLIEKSHVKPALWMLHAATYVYFGTPDVTETFWCWQLIYVASGLKSLIPKVKMLKRCLEWVAKINILLPTIIEQGRPIKHDGSKRKLCWNKVWASFKNLKQSTVMKFIIQLESCEPKLPQSTAEEAGIEDGKSLSYVLIKSWR